MQLPGNKGNPPHDWSVYSSPVQLKPSEVSRREESRGRGRGGGEGGKEKEEGEREGDGGGGEGKGR